MQRESKQRPFTMGMVEYTCKPSTQDVLEAILGYIETLSVNTLQNYEKGLTLLWENPVQAVALSTWKEVTSSSREKNRKGRSTCSLCLCPSSFSQMKSLVATWDRNIRLRSRLLLTIIFPRKSIYVLCISSYASPKVTEYISVQNTLDSVKPKHQQLQVLKKKKLSHRGSLCKKDWECGS